MCAMRRSSSSNRPDPSRHFDVTLTVGGQEFIFPLMCRVLELTSDVHITYYWIDQRLLRGTNVDPSRNLCRRIVDFWELVQSEYNPFGAHSPSEGLVLARAFSGLSRRKRMHQRFRDASLRRLGRNEVYRTDLPEELRVRVDAAVGQHESDAVRVEFARILGWEPASPVELRTLNLLYDEWIDRALSLFNTNPETGIHQFINEFLITEARARRSSRTSSINRRFLDLVLFESKVCFYECYAVLWQMLIPWLRQNRNLDLVSEQFLRIWHNQNPSLRRRQRENDVTSFEADAFFGHVLSLHPLSGILMSTPELCAIAAPYFRNAGPAPVIQNNVLPPTEYWDLVRAIILAGHIYRLNDVRSPATRNLDSTNLQFAAPLTRTSSPSRNAEMQESLARVARLANFACWLCHSELEQFRCTELDTSNRCHMTGHCNHCGEESTQELDISQLTGRLSPPESN